MLSQAVQSYLELRRALGFELKEVGYQLQSFARFAEARQQRFVRTPTALEWAGLGASPPQRARRLGTVIRFARHLHAEDARHDVPPEGVYGPQKGPRPPPFIFTPTQIQQLLEATSTLRPHNSLRPVTYRTLFALLACTGLRVSEAIGLTLADFTPEGLVIRQSKFRKSRLVPLHETARAALDAYRVRRRTFTAGRDRLFLSERGQPLRYYNVRQAFRTTLRRARISDPSGRRRPSLHSLRHTFTVTALETCPEGRDAIGRHTVALSTYLGHYKTTATYWYLEATPSLLGDIADATERFVTGERR